MITSFHWSLKKHISGVVLLMGMWRCIRLKKQKKQFLATDVYTTAFQILVNTVV